MSYAPTTQRNPSFNKVANSSINLDQQVLLYSSIEEREVYESLSEIYSIITVLDFIEKSYLKDTLDPEQYTSTVNRLLAQYNTLLKSPLTQKQFQSLDHFKKVYNLNCPAAISRLEIGIPATIEHSVSSSVTASSSIPQPTINTNTNANNSSNNIKTNISPKAVAEATGNFITCMDALKLNYKAKDQLHPLLSDLITSITKINSNADFQGRGKLIEWLIKINKMNINDELNEEDTRQLLFDLDYAYKGFYTMLE